MSGTLRVIGLDLSLTSTGVAVIETGLIAYVARITSRPIADDQAQLRRMRKIRDEVFDYMSERATLVVVEGLSHGSMMGQHLTRAGLWHLIMDAIDSYRLPWVEIAPTARAKYATGRGNAAKDDVLAAVVRRFPAVEVRGNDEADALTLAAMGADWLGQPLVEMPAANRTALDKVRWPELMSS